MERLIAAVLLVAIAGSVASAKSGSVLVSAEMRAAGIRNCERFPWAASFRDALIAQLEPWMALSDEELWALLPSQEMPRDAGVMRGDEGCPNCGQAHYQACLLYTSCPDRGRDPVAEHRRLLHQRRTHLARTGQEEPGASHGLPCTHAGWPQAKGPGRRPLARGDGFAGRWVVPAERHHLA